MNYRSIIKAKIINESYAMLGFKDGGIAKEIMQILQAHPKNYEFNPMYKKGLWDGYTKFYKVKNGYMLINKGLLEVVKDYCEENYIKFNIVNQDNFEYNKNHVNEFIKKLNLELTPRDYQLKAVHIALKYRRGIFGMATGSGKSLTQAIIALYLAKEKNKKVVLIVPNVGLVKQFENDFKEYLKNSSLLDWFNNNFHTIYAGKPKHFEKPITLTTWQSIYKSEELFEDVNCIIVDEVQQAKNMEGVLNDILVPYSINTKYKLGFTGSIPKGRVNELTLIGAFGKIHKIVSTKDLIDMGYGTPIEVIIMMLNYPKNISHLITSLSYNQEKKFLNNFSKRNEYIKDLALKVTEKFGNTLILFENIEQGYNLVEQFIKGNFLPKITYKQLEKCNSEIVYTNNISEKSLKTVEKFNKKYNKNIILKSIEEKNIFFIYGEVDADDREIIRQKVENKEKAIIIANYKTFSVGINIKNLHNLILASSTKGFERIVQSLGRTIRKLSGKEKVRIWDIVDNFSKGKQKNYSLKHLEERLNIYLEEEHPIKQKDINFNVNIEEFKLEYSKILNISTKDNSNGENNINKIFEF